MSVVLDIARAYRQPGRVFRRRVGGASSEARALATLMGGCLMVFVAGWPSLQRNAIETDAPLEPMIAGALFAWLFAMPLVAYTLGTLTHLAARLFGGQGTSYAARFALFWALLVASPLWLLNGLVAGFIGPGPELTLVGAVAFGAFVVHWGINLTVAERSDGS